MVMSEKKKHTEKQKKTKTKKNEKKTNKQTNKRRHCHFWLEFMCAYNVIIACEKHKSSYSNLLLLTIKFCTAKNISLLTSSLNRGQPLSNISIS